MKSRFGGAATALLGTLIIALCGGALIAGAVFLVEHLVIRMLIGFGMIPDWITDDHPWALTAAAVVFVAITAPLLYVTFRRALDFENTMRTTGGRGPDEDGLGSNGGPANGGPDGGSTGAGAPPAAPPATPA